MRTFATGIFAAGLVALCGCGNSGYKSVTGVVLLDGVPVPEAAVAFVPEDPHGENATGYTDESGRFVMKSTNVDGVKPGKYKVRIQAIADKAPPTPGMSQIMAEKFAGGGSAKESSKASSEALKQAAKESAAANKAKKLATPPIYNDIDKTPLRADVPGQTEYRFELTKDGK